MPTFTPHYIITLKGLLTYDPGGNIASSWAVLKVMGEEGYMEVARRLMEITQSMKEGIGAIEVG